MRKSTVKLGLKCILAGIMLVTLVTFFHGEIAGLFLLYPEDEARLIALGLFWGGVSGGLGAMISAVGFIRESCPENDVRLSSTIVVVIGMTLLFFLLLLSFFESDEPQNIRTNETITV